MPIWMLLMAAAPAHDDLHPWASFSRDPMLAGTSETVEVETRGVQPGTRDLHFVMRLTRRDLRRNEVLWADSATCPAVRTTIRAMRGLPMPRITSPLDKGSGIAMLDGVGYRFEGPTDWINGRVNLSSNADTPLAAWVDEQLAGLAACWMPAKS